MIMDMESIRIRINQLDDELLRISMNAPDWRLKLAKSKAERLPIYDPSVKTDFERMQQENTGPLDNAAIIRLFERVIDEVAALSGFMRRTN